MATTARASLHAVICKAAVAATNAGGEIAVLDTAGYDQTASDGNPNGTHQFPLPSGIIRQPEREGNLRAFLK
jgi:hypothetical protein